MSLAIKIVLFWALFAASHTLLSHPPIRSRLINKLGQGPFLLVYSLVAFATLSPVMSAFFGAHEGRAAPLYELVQVPGVWQLTIALMLPALLLILHGFTTPNAVSNLQNNGEESARGIVRITRHPAFMGIALMGLAHCIANPRPAELAFFGGLSLYALLGSAHQDWRQRIDADETRIQYFTETSFFPFVAIVQGRNRYPKDELQKGITLAAIVVFGLILASHHQLFM